MSLPATPTHYWPLESSGAAAVGGVDLTGGAGVTFEATTGPFGGGCAVFPGTAAGKFSCAAQSGFRLTADRSILFWFKHNAAGGSHQTVLILGFDYTLDYSVISVGGGMSFGAIPASGNVPAPTRGAGDWHLYCCRYRHAENQISITLDDRPPIWKGPPAGTTNTGGTGFYVGGYPDGTNPLASRLAGPAVYDRVLTEAEVGAYYRTLPNYVVQPIPYPVPILTPVAPSQASFGGTAALTGPAPGTPLSGTSSEWHLAYTPGTRAIELVQVAVDGEYQDNVYRRGLDDTAVVWGAVTSGSSYRFALDTTEFADGDHVMTLVGQDPADNATVVLAEWPFATANGSAHRGIRPQFGSAVVPVGGAQSITWSAWRCDGTTAAAGPLPTVYHDQNANATRPNVFAKPHRDPANNHPAGTLLDEIELTSATSLTLHGPAGGFLQTDRARVYAGDEHRAVPILPAHPTGYPHLGTGQRVLTEYAPGESRFARWMFNLTLDEFDAEPALAAAARAAGITGVQVPLVKPPGTDWAGELEPWLTTEKSRIAATAARLRSLGFGAVVIGDTPFRYPGPPLTAPNHPGGLQTLRAWVHGAAALREVGRAWAESGVVHGTKMVDETGYIYAIDYWANPDNDADWAQARLQEGGFPLFAYTTLGWPPNAANGRFGGSQPYDQPYATPARCAFWSVGATHNHQRDNSGAPDLLAQGTMCAVRRCPPGRPLVVNCSVTRDPLIGDVETPDWFGPEITLVNAGVALVMGVCGLDYYGYDHQTWQQERLQGTGQWGARPGDARWAAMSHVNAAIARFEPYLLQAPVIAPSWGPDWLVGCRGPGKRLLIAVNPRAKAQSIPAAVLSRNAEYSTGTVVSATGMIDFPPGEGVEVPPGGIVFLKKTVRYRFVDRKFKRGYPMAYAPGSTYSFATWFFNVDGTPDAPDAVPDVVVNRNGNTVTPTLTRHDYGDGRYRVSFAIPDDWDDGDTVDVWVSAEVGGHPNYDSASFYVDESTLRVISTDPVSIYVNRTIGTMTALYAGEAWAPVFDFDSDMSVGTYELRLSQNNRRRLTVSSPAFSNAGKRMTFSTTGASTATIPVGLCDVQVVKTSGASPEVVAHKSLEVRRLIV